MSDRITRKQAADILGISVQTLKNSLIAKGRLREVVISERKRFIFRSEVESILNPFSEDNFAN